LLAPRPASALEQTGVRLHAANGFAHAAVDAAVTLGPLEPAEITSVQVLVSPAGGVALASNPAPASDEEAWWSIEHAVSVCLAAGDADALTGGLSERRDVLELCRRVTVEPGGTGWESAVEVRLSDGDPRSAEADEPFGHGRHPASDDDLLRKWRRLVGNDGSALLERLDSTSDAAPSAPLLQHALATA
jgi:2-methylcitrate dehydratase PrpD